MIEPKDITLKLLFFDYSKKLIQLSQDTEFDLIAGLTSAIFNFSNSQNRKIGELIYQRPEFKIENLLDGQMEKIPEEGTLITIRTESYCIKSAVRRKLDFIYNKIIKPLEPLSNKTPIAPSEERLIQDVLLNMPSKKLIRSHSKDLEKYIKEFIKEHAAYGIKAVAIMTEDLTVLKTVNITMDDFQSLLRSISLIPEVDPLTWKFRQGWASEEEQYILTFINSAYIVVNDSLKEPLYYCIVCESGAVLGDHPPRELFMALNDILDR